MVVVSTIGGKDGGLRISTVSGSFGNLAHSGARLGHSFFDAAGHLKSVG